MEQHKCSRCGEPATHVIVGGCLEYMHVQVRFYCRTHWDQIHRNANVRSGKLGTDRLKLTCMTCHTSGRRFEKLDDYIEAEL